MARPQRKKAVRRRPESVTPMETLMTTAPLDRRDVRNILFITGAAIIIRVVFFLLSLENNPVMLNPIMDGRYHQEWAQEILAGDFWGDDVFFRAPLYPYLLALLFKMTGANVALVIVFQHILGAASAALVYVLARQFFKPVVATVAGALAALYWPFIYFEGDLLIVSLIVFLDLVALIVLVRSLRRPGLRLPLLAGVIIGLSAVARPSILVLFPVAALSYYIRQRTVGVPVARTRIEDNDDAASHPATSGSAGVTKGPGRQRWWLAQTALLLAGGAIVISPILVRNYIVGRDIVPIASQGGVNFYIGNNPESDGRTAIVPGTRWDWWGGYEDAIAIAERERGRKLKPSEVSNYYFERGLAWVFGSPGQSIPLAVKKFYLFWAGGERSNNKYIYFFWKQSGMGRVPLPGFWLVAPFGLAGAVLLWRRRSDLALLYLFVVVYMLGVVAFFVNARFRLPVVPVLIVFAAFALVFLWRAVRARHPSAWRAVAAVIAFGLLVNLDFVSFRENTAYADSLSHYTLGNAYLRMGRLDGAIAEYEESRRKHRLYPTPGYRLVERNVNYNLGRLYATSGRCERAIPLLDQVRGDDEFTWLAKELLAGCYLSAERYELAGRAYDEILRAFPDHTAAREGLVRAVTGQARALEARGDGAAARELLRRARERFPGNTTLDSELNRLGGP